MKDPVGPNGELYVAYAERYDIPPGNRLFLRRSFDGGQTFEPEPAITIATRMDVWGGADHSRFPGTFRVPQFNYFAVDQNNGTLYCVYFDRTNIVGGNHNIDLYFTKSINSGLTWTTPVVINGDSNPPGDQFFPWIEVDEDSNLHMVFLDSRHVVQNDNAASGALDAYYSFSHDGGATWQEFRLTPGSFDSEYDGFDFGFQFLGDYLGLARSRDRVYPCYLSTWNGDPDIYTHVITILGGCCFADSCALLSNDSCASQGGTFLGTGSTCTEPDCDNDGIPDECDPDCNANGIPDDCETALLGACCSWDAECISASECSCPGYFFGAGTHCKPWYVCAFLGPQP